MPDIGSMMLKAVSDIRKNESTEYNNKLEDNTYQVDISGHMYNVTVKDEKVVHTEPIR